MQNVDEEPDKLEDHQVKEVKGMQKAELSRLRILHLSLMVCFVLWLPCFAAAQTQEIDDGLAWLIADQNSGGSWGDPDTTGFRDTAVAVDVLQKLREKGAAYDAAFDYLQSEIPLNTDQLARKAMVLVREGLAAPEINDLFAGQNAVETDVGRPNYPEGGWGPAQGYATDCLDTSLALDALYGAGLAGGLAVYDETVAAGEEQSFQFELPEGATSLSVVITALSGEIRFQLKPGVPPGPGDPYYSLTSAPISLSGLPVVAGTNYIKVTGVATSSTYSFEVSYVVDGFDSLTLLTPVNYLKASQNVDGGWGLARGADSSLFLTSRVLISLQSYESFYGLSLEVLDGVSWLGSNQNVDGGFGALGSTVYETALAYVALARSDISSLAAQNALAFLLASQQTNGSWNDDPYDTAVALWALWTSRGEIDTDSDGVPDNIDNCPDDMNSDQLNTDGDWWGDVCDDDDDNDGLSDDFEINQAGTNPLLADSDYDGINDDLEDFDFDGISNIDEETAGSHPQRPDKDLVAGLNLFGYPVAVSAGYSAYDLLYDLGDETEVSSIQRYNRASGEMESVYYATGIAAGVDFDVTNTEGYYVYMNSPKTITFVGDISCPTVGLVPGFNIAAMSCVPPGYSSYDLLQTVGEPGEVAGIQHFNTQNGQFETTGYFEGQAAGTEFGIVHGTSYLIHMGVAADIAPFLTGPVVQITSPADGALVTESSITVSGTVSDSLATVTVNSLPATVTGNSFTVSDVPLTEGENTITALARDSNNLTGSHSISVTLEAADYVISKGGSVSDSDRFQADAAVLDQVAYYTENQIGVPPSITYTTTGVTRVTATEMEISFTIAVSPSATEGFYDFQVEYGLLDSSFNPLGPLTGNVFDFRVKVVP